MRHKLILACSVCFASCSNVSTPTLPSITPYKIEIRQGNLITADMREKIRVGMTPPQVRAALGTPLLIDPFHPNRWDYQYRYEQEGKLVRQQRLTLYFDNELLARIDEHDMVHETAAPQASTPPTPAVAPASGKLAAATPAVIETAPQAAAAKAESAPAPVAAHQPETAPQPESKPEPAPAQQVEARQTAVKADSPAAMPAATAAVSQAAEGQATGQENGAEHKKLVEKYREGAEQGNAEAQFNLGRMYDFGYGVQQDFKVAAEWYRKAGKQGYAQAYYNLGLMNEHGRGVRKDDKKAAARYREAADLGDAKAQYVLGMMYAKGRGVPHDDKLAMSWYRKAAAQGYADAMARLGAGPAQEEARPLAAPPVEVQAAPPAVVEAAPLAAAQAVPRAEEGKAASADQENNPEYRKMAQAYRKGAEQNNAEAQYNLGQMYELGYGVPQDYKTAAEWYRKAGRQKYAKAFFNLGVMNELGRGVAKDDKKAAARYQEAAELGDARAQYTLGLMYAKGRGVAQDVKAAMYWYRRAAQLGHAEAQVLVSGAPEPEVQAVAATPARPEAATQVAAVKVETAPKDRFAQKSEPAPNAKAAASAPQTLSAEAEQAIIDAVKNWAAAWSSQDVAKYLASYAQTFRPADGMSRAAWEAQRKERVAKPQSVSVELSGLHVDAQGENRASAHFRQSYRADQYGDVTDKTLELKKTGEKWLIVSEWTEKVAVMPPVTVAKVEAAPKTGVATKAEPAPGTEPAPATSATHALSAETEQAIADAVKNWAAAWSAKDVDKYLASYAQAFRPADGMSRADWEMQRRERVAKPKAISVELSGITVNGTGENSATASFRQGYRADSYKDVTNKTLVLKKINDKWLIMSEQVSKK